MPAVEVRLQSIVRLTFRVEQVAGMFDLPVGRAIGHSLMAEVPGLDEAWSLGAIVGPSGSGKTTLARAAFGRGGFADSAWPSDRALIDCLDECAMTNSIEHHDVCPKDGSVTGRMPVAHPRSIKDLTRVLIGVGLGCVSTWLKPYSILSTGEQFRATLARGLLARSDVLVCDEFTSALDRTIAKTTSAAVARLLRGKSLGLPRLVAVTCHEDVLPWLTPDWVVALGGDDGPKLRWPAWGAPNVALTVQRVPQAMWDRFAEYHYLSGGLAKSATCYGTWAAVNGTASDGVEARLPSLALPVGGGDVDRSAVPSGPAGTTLVGFCAVVATLGWKRTKHITRLVVRPEFQGLGVGGRMLAAVAKIEAAKGNRVTITATHPAIVSHCSTSPQWRLTNVKKAGSTPQRYAGREIRSSKGRAVASFEFIA